MTVPSQKIKDILDKFNSFHPRMQFTMEIRGKKLNFLDIMIINNNNVLKFDWFKKTNIFGLFTKKKSNYEYD